MIRCIWARDGVSGSSSDASMMEDNILDFLDSWSRNLDVETAKEKEI
jgi:hypothetical protein